MLADLLARFRSLRHNWQRLRRARQLSAVDAAALARQVPPDAGRVLVVRNDSIGDYLLFRPWLRQLSHMVRGRGQRLTLAANAAWAPLAQAWDADLWDELLVVDFGRFMRDMAYRTATLKIIGAGGYGEVVYPLHVRESAVENFIQFLRAPVRVGSLGEYHHERDGWFRLLNAGYTHLLPATRQTLFEYDRNGEFFRNWQALGELRIKNDELRIAAADAPPLRLPLAEAIVAAAQVQESLPYLVLFPGASARPKRWPTSHFAQLAQALHQRYAGRYRLVVAGSPDDNEFAREIQHAAGPTVPLDNRCGQTDLPGLAALVAGAALLISNDTVAAHLAAQAGTPCLVLLMGENYGKFFPYPPHLLQAPCRCLCPPSQEVRFARNDFSLPYHEPDISTISVERALAAVVELL
ncbi:MAG: glycosyltransferase family 9 protein [Janthinobacterium lividum]